MRLMYNLGPHRSRINARNGVDYGSKSFIFIVISQYSLLTSIDQSVNINNSNRVVTFVFNVFTFVNEYSLFPSA